MTDRWRGTTLAPRILSLAAIVFGLATIMAGARVLAGTDPGYVVFRPLLIYNTLMGVAYLTAGGMIWRDLRKGSYAAAMIFGLNCFVLGGIGVLYLSKAGVAVDSVRAMTFRTGVWLVLWAASAWLGRSSVAPHRG